MRFLPIINEQSALTLRRCPLVAVDVGFSSQRPTTGVAYPLQSQNFKFREAVSVAAEQCQQHDEVALILEAPLSAVFDANGNPQPRGDFERKPKPRGWYCGPGAATALSALFFFENLNSK